MSGSSPPSSAWTPLTRSSGFSCNVMLQKLRWRRKCCNSSEGTITHFFCNQAYFQLSTKATTQLCFSSGSHEILFDTFYHNQRDVSSTKKIINWSSWLMTMASAGKLREQGSSIHIIQKVTERLDDLVKLADHSDKG